MNDIFVSYKREDERRVAPLVRALEGAGYSVWWDRGLPGGESCRQQIERALEDARCVVVVWTHASVGPQGDFVRDEAGRAKRRGLLVPVRLDRVEAPLGFGEIQATDLTRWKGDSRDPFFTDLCAAIAAKLEGRAPPPAIGPVKRLRRRLAYGGMATAFGFASMGFGYNFFGLQEQLCVVPPFQPALSDLCGAVGLGRRPTRDERVAWESRARGSCEALRAHIERFPDGVHRSTAADLLSARRTTQTETWAPGRRQLLLYVGQDGPPAATEAAARKAALDRAQSEAERLCAGFAVATTFRLKAVAPEPRSWRCERQGPGMTCGLEGVAICEVEERRDRQDESCAG